MQQISHHWNGRWGRLARQDIRVFRSDDGQRWWVDHMRGGVEGRTTRFDDLDERRARQLADELMSEQGNGWRELSR
jgi:hypothetical protein